jgi:hypothetical protein
MSTPGPGLPVSQSNGWDWRVVVLELCIVFVGLFAALQLDSYREDRQFRQDQERHLKRLQVDIADYLEITSIVQEFLDQNHVAVAHVSDSLQAGEIINDDTLLFEQGVIYFAHLPFNPLLRSSYEEMVASGMFSALESENLKSAIANLFFTHDFTENNFSWWRQGALEFENLMMSHVDYYDDPGIIERPGFLNGEPIRRVRYDFEALAASREIRNGFYWAKDVTWDWSYHSARLRNQAVEVEAMIERHFN